MTPPRIRHAARAFMLGLLLTAGSSSAAGPGDDSERLDRGRALFERGEGLDPVIANLAGDLEVDGASMPCASCHGRDGSGREESGFAPTSLHWSNLTRPYRVATDSGREHGPYTPGLLKRAVTLGLDPSGNELLNIMPRYTMSLRDLDALVAYIQTLDRPAAASTLRVALPRTADTKLRAFEDANLETVRAALEQVNQRGGLYGRTIELVELTVPPGASPEMLRDELDRIRPVALLGGLLSYADSANAGALIQALQRTGVPWIGPRGLGVAETGPVFLLEADLASQAMALARWALERDQPAGPWWIVVGKDPDLERVADVVESMLETRAVTGTRVRPFDLDPDALPANATVLLLAPADRLLARPGSPPQMHRWLQPVSLTNSRLVDALGRRLWLAAPNWPFPRQLPAWEELRELDSAGVLGTDHLGARMSAIAAARVLVDVLSRSGRDASPETLIEELEELYQFDAGLGRPVSFGAGRREANPGAFIFQPDLAAAPEWQPAR